MYYSKIKIIIIFKVTTIGLGNFFYVGGKLGRMGRRWDLPTLLVPFGPCAY
jgi:hypothetical protein